LLDARGNVVGINTAIRRANYAEGIGFALPINHARRVIEQLRETGSVRRGYIGITMNPEGIDEVAKEYLSLPDANGVIVDQITEGGPADRAGIQKDDVIRKVDGDPITDNLDLISKISARRPGDTVKLEIFRKGRTLEFDATLADREEGLRAQLGGPERGQPDRLEPQASSGLGITVENLTGGVRERMGLEESQRGVLVTEVDFDSSAWLKGLRPNITLITGISDTPIGDVSDWVEAIEGLEPGESIKLSILAPGGPRSVFLRVPESAE
jgi:serine protease Do